eukprot:g6190.t1
MSSAPSPEQATTGKQARNKRRSRKKGSKQGAVDVKQGEGANTTEANGAPGHQAGPRKGGGPGGPVPHSPEKQHPPSQQRQPSSPTPVAASSPPRSPASPSSFSSSSSSSDSASASSPSPSSPTPAPTATATTSNPISAKDGKDLTTMDYYFDSYSHFGIHEEMLKDEVRMDRYRRAITHNRHLFKGKVVLDVGCGTGILSMFAAKAGAKMVYGVDMASIADQATKIVKANGLSDRVQIIRGKIEDITLPVKQVDIIISEWMGYFLLYESMLDTVLIARDKWLKKGGLIFPDKASLYLCAIEDSEYRKDKIDFWDDVEGFDMSCIKEMALLEPLVDCCEAEQIISNGARVLDVDIYTVKKEDLDFTGEFKLELIRSDYVHALVAYFTVDFTETHTKIRLATGPRSPYTHWKQTVFYLKEPFVANRLDTITGKIKVKRNDKNPRDLDIQIDCQLHGKHATTASQFYRLR